jgi:hypothetical protein
VLRSRTGPSGADCRKGLFGTTARLPTREKWVSTYTWLTVFVSGKVAIEVQKTYNRKKDCVVSGDFSLFLTILACIFAV